MTDTTLASESLSRSVSRLSMKDGIEGKDKDAYDDEIDGSDPINGISVREGQMADVEGLDVELGDGEKVIHMLCDYENGFNLLLKLIKRSTLSTKECTTFLRKRAQIEEEYGKAMSKLAQQVLSTSTSNQGVGDKASVSALNAVDRSASSSTFDSAWIQLLKMHDELGSLHTKLSTQVSDLAEELSALSKNTERSRKQLKTACLQHTKTLHDSENLLEKVKTRFESSTAEWEGAILQRESLSQQLANPGLGGMVMPKSSSAGKLSGIWGKSGSANPVKLKKLEEDALAKANQANEAYKQQLNATNVVRSAYWGSHLPRFVRLLKETQTSTTSNLQTHLHKYATLLESTLCSEGHLLSPLPSSPDPSLTNIITSINNSHDFTQYLHQHLGTKLSQKNIDTYSLVSNRPSFCLDLQTLLERDGCPVPIVVQKLIQHIEHCGMATQGIYRLSGNAHAVQRLRGMLNKDPEVCLDGKDGEAWDIHVITGALKLFFRELPDPLFPRSVYRGILEAAAIEDERMRLINIHEFVNALPDVNYITLQALIGHLWRVAKNENHNNMSVVNLSIIWGPTLLDAPKDGLQNQSTSDIKLQTRVVEVVIANYDTIFDTES
ncbi:hypothetical protein HDU85_007715 [Gaertneriomyces sp. JEL0708]|nr:hypothetical protein HDU85_007715 [Gaertneriomyces sp. JEL0708]